MTSFDVFPIQRADATLEKELIIAANDRDERELRPNHKAILDHFNARTGGTRLPRRDDLDPAAIPAQLPGLLLLDIDHNKKDEDGNATFHVRLMGELFKEFYGDLTGKGLEALPTDETRDRFLRTIAVMFDTRTPVIAEARRDSPDGLPIQVFMLFFPLFDTEETIHQTIIHTDIEVG